MTFLATLIIFPILGSLALLLVPTGGVSEGTSHSNKGVGGLARTTEKELGLLISVITF